MSIILVCDCLGSWIYRLNKGDKLRVLLTSVQCSTVLVSIPWWTADSHSHSMLFHNTLPVCTPQERCQQAWPLLPQICSVWLKLVNASTSVQKSTKGDWRTASYKTLLPSSTTHSRDHRTMGMHFWHWIAANGTDRNLSHSNSTHHVLPLEDCTAPETPTTINCMGIKHYYYYY